MGAASIFAWLKLRLQKWWHGTSGRESTPTPQCPPWLDLTPTPDLILAEILSNLTDRVLSHSCYHRLLDMFEAGNKAYAAQETRLRALKALDCLMKLSHHPQAEPFAQRAMNYLKYCYNHKKDGRGHVLFSDILKMIHDHLPPEPIPAVTAASPIFVSFAGAARVNRPPDSDLFLDNPLPILFDMATDPGICQSSQRMAFEALLRLFERGNSSWATPAESTTSIDAINLINQIAQSPQQSSFAWEALIYLANCYNHRMDGANHPLTKETQRDLGLLLTIMQSRQAIKDPKP